jgi:hypothetical protein
VKVADWTLAGAVMERHAPQASAADQTSRVNSCVAVPWLFVAENVMK